MCFYIHGLADAGVDELQKTECPDNIIKKALRLICKLNMAHI